MPAVTRIKTKAQPYAPQTLADCAADIRAIGDVSRDFERQRAEMNDQVAAITARYQPQLEALAGRLETLQKGVETYCAAHRDELTDGNKVKSHNFVTGVVQWRLRPPSVTVRGAETVIETLKRLGLANFVRTKEEVNKEAILNETAKVRGVAGITVVTGVEDFVITPAEVPAEAA